MASWDDPNPWGRENRRLAKSALRHLTNAIKVGNAESAQAWSIVYARHSREALSFMQFKRLVILDTDGMVGAKVPPQQRAPQTA